MLRGGKYIHKRYTHSATHCSAVGNTWLLLIALLCFSTSKAQDLNGAVNGAQNVEGTIKKIKSIKDIKIKNLVKISGGLNLNNSFYLADGISNRMRPYTYTATGNLNIKVWELNVPLTFTYSNQNLNYRYPQPQPFNILGLSPYYKTLTLHGGYRNLSYSGYTLNGHAFLGGGVDWKPKMGFIFSAMGGRFLKAVPYDSIESPKPSYERWGAAAKVGYQKGGDEIALIWFGARDKVGSIQEPPLAIGLTAQENMVWSLALKKKLSKTLSVNFEGARSAWTKDITSVEASDRKGINLIFFSTQRQSTTYYGAYKGSINKDFNTFKVGLNYERVEPEYRTLGAYYFNTDMENINGSFSTILFKKKLNLSTNLGMQHDDLNHTKISKMKRMVGSLNVSYKASARLNLTAAYSNFNSFVNVQPLDKRFVQQTPYERIDTLNYVQVTQSVNASASYRLSDNTDLSRNVSCNGSFNASSNKQGSNAQVTNMATGGANFSQVWKKSQMSLGIGTTYNQSSFATGISKYAGLTANASRPLLKKKIKATLTVTVNNNYENDVLKARLLSVNNNYNMRVGKRHSFRVGLRYMGRAKLGEATLTRYNTTFNEFFADAGYAFSF